MAWFIFSEVMFFAAFFGALYYARELSLPWLGGDGSGVSTNRELWPSFENVWPSNGPANYGGDFVVMKAAGILLSIQSYFLLAVLLLHGPTMD